MFLNKCTKISKKNISSIFKEKTTKKINQKIKEGSF